MSSSSSQSQEIDHGKAVSDESEEAMVEETTTDLKKGPWTKEEDDILRDYVEKNGEGNWNAVRKNTGLARCGKSCRLRWSNHLNPHLRKGAFSLEEENKIITLHAQWGNKWARIAVQLPGRTDNEIKNYWNTRIKKMQRAGLPLYPAEITPEMLKEYKKNNASSSNQQGEDGSRRNSDDIPELVLKNYKHEGKLPPYFEPSSMFNHTTLHSSSSLNRSPILFTPKQLHGSSMLHNGSNLRTQVNIAALPLMNQNLFQRNHNISGNNYPSLSGSSSKFGAMELPKVPQFPCIETEQGNKGNGNWGMPSSPIPSVDDYLVDPTQEYIPQVDHTQFDPDYLQENGYLESIFYPPKNLDETNSNVEEDLANLEALPEPECDNDNDNDPLQDTLFAIINKHFKGSA